MSYQFTNMEFKSMMFNPTKVPEGGSVFKTFPELLKFKIFKKSAGEGIDNEKIMLFILCMYDKSNPYRIHYPDVLKRKLEIAHDIGFKVSETGNFEDPIEDMLKGKNKVVNAKIVEFVRIQRSHKYAYLVAIESSYYNLMADVIDGATKRISELRSIQEELEETMLQILNDDNNPFLKDAVLRYVEEERLQLKPEDIALKILNNESPISYKEIQ